MQEATTKQFDPRAGIILIETRISARLDTTAQLVFDTGATYCMLPWNIVTKIGVDIDQEKTIQTTTASTVETSPLVNIPKMTVMGQTIKNVRCIVRDLPPMSGVDGLLGLSFLKFFNIEINFEEGFIELGRYEQ